MSLSVLITGAKRGIGFGVVQQYAADPNIKFVFATTRETDPAELLELATQHKGKVHIVTMDPTVLASARQAAKQVESILGGAGLDILINNAGTAKSAPVLETEAPLLHEMLEANVVSAQNTTIAFFDLLKKGPTKKVINISSLIGSITDTDGRYPFDTAAYSMAKAALNMLTRYYAKDYAKDGFIFIALSPGYVKTALSPEATLTVAESAKGIINVIGNLTSKDSSKFYSYDSTTYPW